MSDYCWRFGEHEGDPCDCGWTSQNDLSRFLNVQLQEAKRHIKDDQAQDQEMQCYLRGIIDGLQRVVHFVKIQEKYKP